MPKPVQQFESEQADIGQMLARIEALEHRQGKLSGAIALIAKGLQELRKFRAGWTDKAAEAGVKAELLIRE